MNANRFRRALSLSDDEVRASAARGFSRLIGRAEDGEETWGQLGLPFFREIWPVEPTLQSAETAQALARIPGQLSLSEYAEAVGTILPYLRPFAAWDVQTSFSFREGKDELLAAYPHDTVALLAACIPEDWGSVYGLHHVLEVIRSADANITSDTRYRRLVRHAASTG